MADHSVRATLIIRHDTKSNWTIRNPILASGEYGFEYDTRYLKIGDGIHQWADLPYLNKLDEEYFKWNADGTITFSDTFLDTVEALEALAGNAISHITITDAPVNDTDAANKKYVDDAIRDAGHLKRSIVTALPSAANADPNTLYMILAQSGDHYDEYMVINGAWDLVGSTGDSNAGNPLEIASPLKLGGVKSAPLDNQGRVLEDDDYVVVDQTTGFMTLHQVSTSLLYVPSGDTLVLNGGSASI